MSCAPRHLAGVALAVAVLAPLSVLAAQQVGLGLGQEGPAADARRAAGDPAAVARLADDAPAPQAAMLQDGVVSDREYENALRTERDCVITAGYQPDELEWDDGQLGFVTTVSYLGEPDPEAADETFLAMTDQCRRDYSTLVASVWVAQR